MTDNAMDIFGTFTKDDAVKTREGMSSGADWIKYDKNVTVVTRFLPPLQGEALPWELIYQHFIKIPGGKTLTFNCPRKMKNERCPACEKADKLDATGNTNDEVLAKEFRPGFRAIARAFDRDRMDAGVRPVGISSTVMKRLNHFREKLNKDFVNPNTGSDIAIEYLGQAPWYQVDLLDPSPLASTPQGLADIVQQMRNLPLKPFAKVLSYEDIVAKFSGDANVRQVASSSPRAAIGSAPGAVDTGDDPF